MRPEVKLNRFEISNRFEMSFRLHGSLHGDFTAATFQTVARLASNFNDSVQLYFAAAIHCLHGKLTAVWNLHRSEFHYARSHLNADNEVTSRRSEILNRSEFTSGLM